MGLGFLKKLKPSKKWLKGIYTGVKFAGQYADILPVVGIPAIAIKTIRGTMALVEAKGAKHKAKMAVLLALPILKKANVNLPTQKLNLIVELLRDPDIMEGLYDFNLAGEADKVASEGLSAEQLALIEALEKRLDKTGG
jgi:hypothetical protein